ncbi:MAG: hypothetical protein EZS28_002541 [Streblomastix strix]|uniref:Uncharacterized protein n=1 Tax=Streblomastix strix TaxID=222440 RepID=A0A5J4X5M9_9EUKA|nr:MAG: hypothetical protein EZS28_002541 [Streblomastix strix]
MSLRYDKKIRNKSKECLDFIHRYGNVQDQVELVTNGYPRVLVRVINTAGGNEQQKDEEICFRLICIYWFIKAIFEGRETNPDYKHPYSSLPPQPVLFKSCQEQIEDEGENEEIEAQLINKWEDGNIKDRVNLVKGSILNIFFDRSNPKPWGYN